MSRQLTPESTLENLKREAKRWLKALRANVSRARDRLEGQTAESRADRRGMSNVAEVLRSASSSVSRPTMQQYETMAKNPFEADHSGG